MPDTPRPTLPRLTLTAPKTDYTHAEIHEAAHILIALGQGTLVLAAPHRTDDGEQ